MPRRLIAGAAVAVVLAGQGVVTAWAVTSARSATTTGAASASDGGGTIRVGVQGTTRRSGKPGANRAGSRPVHGGRRRATSSAPVPAPAPTCSDVSLPTKYAAPLGPGGLATGVFTLATCPGGTLRLANGVVVLVPSAPAVGPGVRPTAASALVQQAENSLELPSPVIGVNPAAFTVVNLATWLWIDPGTWRAFAVTARAGAVAATVVAMPERVTWSMGDGGSVTCPGPGTPYLTDQPSTAQSTSCAYTYRVSSYGGGDGTHPGGGTFAVTATVTWAVTWSVTGAPGGGALPPLETSASTALRVEQVESIDTAD